MEIQTKTNEKYKLTIGELVNLIDVKLNNTIVLAGGRRELVNRIIPSNSGHLIITIAKNSDGSIAERTYRAAPEVLTYNRSINEIPAGHERYNELSKLIDENLGE